MALRIYIRQHSPKCLKRIDDRVAKSEIDPLSDEALMNYRHCKCGWWISGTSDSGVPYKQQALKVYSYAAADAKRKDANKSTADPESGMSLKALVDEFLADREATGTINETRAIYKRIGYRLVDFCDSLTPKVTKAGKVLTKHITAIRRTWIGAEVDAEAETEVETDDGNLGNRKSTVNYHIGILRMIFRYGVEQRHITTNPTDSMKAIGKDRKRGSDMDDGDDEEEGENGRTLPLDGEGDENYRKVLAGVEPFLAGKLIVPGRKFARAKIVPFLLDWFRFRLLLELMYETGLRISDAIHFRPSKIVIEEGIASYTTRQIKTRVLVTVFFPLELAEQIKTLKPLYKQYVFFDGSMPWRQFISDVIYRTLHDLGDAVGVEGVRPHRFRDSFAVNCLNDGMLIEFLSILLGHRDPKTTRKYYNPWVKSRHDHLRNTYLAARRSGELLRTGVVVPITQKDKRLA